MGWIDGQLADDRARRDALSDNAVVLRACARTRRSAFTHRHLVLHRGADRHARGRSSTPPSCSATRPATTSYPKPWVAVVDIIAALTLAYFVVKFLRRPRDPKRAQSMIDQMSKIATSPWIAIVAAGATLANPGGFIPLALKEICNRRTRAPPSTSSTGCSSRSCHCCRWPLRSSCWRCHRTRPSACSSASTGCCATRG